MEKPGTRRYSAPDAADPYPYELGIERSLLASFLHLLGPVACGRGQSFFTPWFLWFPEDEEPPLFQEFAEPGETGESFVRLSGLPGYFQIVHVVLLSHQRQ